MYESALRDGLTKAFNKKYFTDRLESEFDLRDPPQVAAGAGDVRHRPLQEGQRHPRPPGRRLRAVGARRTLLTGALRAEDVFARYGGEEFAVICRGTDARAGADRRRADAQGGREAPLHVYEGTHIPVTISVGIAGLPDPAVKDATDLVSRADKALYQSKHGGRNRVTIHQPDAGIMTPAFLARA